MPITGSACPSRLTEVVELSSTRLEPAWLLENPKSEKKTPYHKISDKKPEPKKPPKRPKNTRIENKKTLQKCMTDRKKTQIEKNRKKTRKQKPRKKP
jgi:hypothetical protein